MGSSRTESEHLSGPQLREMVQTARDFTEAEYQHVADCDQCMNMFRAFLHEKIRVYLPSGEGT